MLPASCFPVKRERDGRGEREGGRGARKKGGGQGGGREGVKPGMRMKRIRGKQTVLNDVYVRWMTEEK